MKIVLLGPPGSGKGTQAHIICEKYNLPHISTGDIFRANIANQTELGKKAKAYMDQGSLVPDELTISIVVDRLQQPDCEKGFVFDGFPRNLAQAKELDKMVTLDKAIMIHLDDEEIIKQASPAKPMPNVGGGSTNEKEPDSKETKVPSWLQNRFR